MRVPPPKKLFGGIVPPNNFFGGGTVPPNNFFGGGTVPPNSHFLSGYLTVKAIIYIIGMQLKIYKINSR